MGPSLPYYPGTLKAAEKRTRRELGMATIDYWADDLGAAKDRYAGLLGLDPYFRREGRGNRQRTEKMTLNAEGKEGSK